MRRGGPARLWGAGGGVGQEGASGSLSVSEDPEVLSNPVRTREQHVEGLTSLSKEPRRDWSGI